MQPIAFRDADFGMVRLRSFGKYSFRVVDSPLLVNTLVGTQGKYTTEAVASYLKDLIVARLTDLLGTLKIGLLDLPAKYDEVAAGTRAKVAEEFAKYGLELVDFFINAITPPEEVQKAIDARSAMGAVGDLNAFMKFQAANSMAKLAEQGGRRRHGRRGDGHGHGRRLRHDDARHDPAGDGRRRRRAAPHHARRRRRGRRRARARLRRLAPSRPIRRRWSAPWPPPPATRSPSRATRCRSPCPSARCASRWSTSSSARPTRPATPMVNYWSVCGPYVEKNAAELLRYNTGTLHGAFAVKKIGTADMVVLQTNQLAETVTPLEVSRVLSAIAWQADQVEQKLVGDG